MVEVGDIWQLTESLLTEERATQFKQPLGLQEGDKVIVWKIEGEIYYLRDLHGWGWVCGETDLRKRARCIDER